MMIKYPKSLTATIHIVFHEDGSQVREIKSSQVELISRILNQAFGLDPEMQELLVKFARFLRECDKEKKAEPS